MYTISQVCNLVGVTRRTLQEYRQIGLISPTAYTEGGYWLYDEQAVSRLECIQVFVQAGYERKKIKAKLEDPGFDYEKELDRMIGFLQEKQRRINGMIQWARLMKLPARLPAPVMDVWLDQKEEPGMSFRDQVEQAIRFGET